MEQNDTHVFDLLTLSPVLDGGWVLLGELGAYVSVSRDRFERIDVTPSGASLRVSLLGSQGETVDVTALRPVNTSSSEVLLSEDWVVLVKSVTFKGSSGKAEVVFDS